MQLDKAILYTLQPTMSAACMYYPDAMEGRGRDSYYQGHLTLDADTNRWIAWVEYDRYDGYGPTRAFITKVATTLDHALAQLNDRLNEKERGGRNQRAYRPLAGKATGRLTREIVEERMSFIAAMEQQFVS